MEGAPVRRIAVFVIAAALVAPAGARAAEECSWSMYGGTQARTMSQTESCSDVSALNVASLHLKWAFDAGAPVTAQPAVVGDTVYVGAADGVFYALPADAVGTPDPRWTFTIDDENLDSYGKFVSSAAVADVAGARIVAVGGGSTLYVLDAATGKKLGSSCFDPRSDPAVRCAGSEEIIEILSSPAIVVAADGQSARIYVGVDYNEGGIGRGGIVRHTLARAGDSWTLTPDWKFDPEALVPYHTDVFTQGGRGQGCGNTWSSPMINESLNLLYFGVSNCSSGRYDDESLYGGEAIFAIDLDSGELVWCYSPRPVNSEDLAFGATPNQLPDGNVGLGGKDGIYYSFPAEPLVEPDHDPTTACRGASGQTPDWETKVSTGNAIGGIIGTPAVGKVGEADAVFAANAVPMPEEDRPETAQHNENTFENPQHLTTLHAIDIATGTVLWDAPNVFPAYSGPVYTNGLVFAPDTFGMNFTAYHADTGLPIWSFPMFAPSGPPAIVGDSIYVGSGVIPSPGTPVLSDIGLIYAFEAVAV